MYFGEMGINNRRYNDYFSVNLDFNLDKYDLKFEQEYCPAGNVLTRYMGITVSCGISLSEMASEKIRQRYYFSIPIFDMEFDL